MRVLSPRTAWHLFVLFVLLILAISYLGDRSANRYADSEAWVSHTQEVQTQIALLRFSMASTSSTRFQVATAPEVMSRYEIYSGSIESHLAELQRLTTDNPKQQENLAKLTPLIRQWRGVVAQNFPEPSEKLTESQQASIAEEHRLAETMRPILEDMQTQEDSLLQSRTVISESYYRRLRMELGAGLFVVLIGLVFSFRTVLMQVTMRATAEQSVRRLSARILKAQDEERRRIARELHDGVGQLFAALVMELDLLAQKLKGNAEMQERVDGSHQIAAQGLSETRTISYLLHPPMLDELGFEHALRWYVEGFTKRSKVEVALNFSPGFKRPPEACELVLFRVIQEALTNVHRHSGSTRAEINVTQHPDRINVSIRDFGKGIATDLLRDIELSSAGAGVGLGGMRERVSELGGHFVLESGPEGTVVNVTVPISPEETLAKGDPTALLRSEDAHTQAAKGRFRGTTMIALLS